MAKVIDLRSDTVTRPSPEMRQAIAQAAVGDDVFGDDPTVIELEKRVAAILGKEAALFVASGTMANQVALRTLCQPGDEVICERRCHLVNDEVAAAAALSGVMLTPYDGQRGQIPLEILDQAIRPADLHFPRTRLVALENTHNRAGGVVLKPDYVTKVAELVRAKGLLFYLDGARLWNAAVALGVEPAALARPFDLVSVCFSKGLGAPIGSAVCGPTDLIIQARRVRKMLGGGMRQVGIIAAAALYALEHNLGRLADDHACAKRFASGLARIPGLSIDPSQVETNIVIFRVEKSVAAFMHAATSAGVLLVPMGGSFVRAVTHLDVDEKDIDDALVRLARVMAAI